jgi:hypothetical protein
VLSSSVEISIRVLLVLEVLEAGIGSQSAAERGDLEAKSFS